MVAERPRRWQSLVQEVLVNNEIKGAHDLADLEGRRLLLVNAYFTASWFMRMRQVMPQNRVDRRGSCSWRPVMRRMHESDEASVPGGQRTTEHRMYKEGSHSHRHSS